jgi:hypothetical protein
VWQPAAENNGRLAHFFQNLKGAKQPIQSAAGSYTQPSNFNFKKVRQNGLFNLQWAVVLVPDCMGSRASEPHQNNIYLPIANISRRFFLGQRNPLRI